MTTSIATDVTFTMLLLAYGMLNLFSDHSPISKTNSLEYMTSS